MSGETWVILGALVVVVLVAALMGRRLIGFTLEVFGMKVGAKGERGGARVSKARADRDIDVEHEGSGEARVDRAAAGRDIRVSSRGGADPDGD